MPVEKKLTTRQRNALITKQTIYDTAIDLFIKKGFENVKIEEITSAANVAKGTFYIYFESKKHLLYHTFEQLDKVYVDTFDQMEQMDDFEHLLVTFLSTSYQTNNIVKEIAKALYYNNILEKDPMLLSNDRALFQIIRKIVQIGLSTGQLNKEHPEDFYVELIKAQIIGFDYLWIVSSDDIDFSDFTKRHIYALTHGLLNL